MKTKCQSSLCTFANPINHKVHFNSLEKKLNGENFNQVQLDNIKSFMCEAIKEARLALDKGEVGAIKMQELLLF